MELKKLEYNLTVCKVASADDIDLNQDFYFIGKTDEELSLVCRTENTPKKLLSAVTAGRGSVYRVFWIFL